MKTISIQVPDDFQLPDNYEIKVVERKPKFKKGDVIVSINEFIAIYEKTVCDKTGYPIVYYSTSYSSSNGLYKINSINHGIGSENNCRLANETEKNILINALKAEVINKTEKAYDARKVLKETFNINIDPIRTYQDLIDNEVMIEKGYWIDDDSKISRTHYYSVMSSDKNMAASEKVAKSMLAMAQISQLMPYYGGEITDEEWLNMDIAKYTIINCDSNPRYSITYNTREFLAFHNREQRDEFLKYNEQLVKDYLMID